MRALLILILLAGPAAARLAEITLTEFQATAPCAVIGVVEKIAEIDAEERRGGELRTLNREATIRVLERVGRGDCEQPSGSLALLFATEVHSSHPAEGERAMVFLGLSGGSYVEAVYGRSYWPLSQDNGEWHVLVNWRNTFLIGPLELLSGETARVPVNSIRRLWETGK